MKKQYKKIRARHGAALLLVLFIVMAITVLSLGFLSRCDTELACGQNTLLHEQMDSLAYSGLQHARGLILYPQELPTDGYWTGEAGQQFMAGNDYYDVKVAMHDSVNDPDPAYRCTYNINSEAYRLKNGTKTARSAVEAELRLDPCIAYWAGIGGAIPSRMYVYGDTYCNGSLLNSGFLSGDVFTSALTGTAGGQITAANSLTTVAWPNLKVSDFTSSSNYSITPNYSVQTIPATLASTGALYTTPKVYNCGGSMNIQGGVTLNGMLVVQGDLLVSGSNNSIIAGKNLPALYVTGDLIILDSAELNITGLAVVDNRVRIRASAGNVNVYGGLFVKNGLYETTADLTSYANTAFLYNGPTWRPDDGQVNGSIELDGLDDFLQTPDSSSPAKIQLSGDYTFSVYIKADATQKPWAAIFSKTDPGGNLNYWTLQFDSSSPQKLVIYHPNNKYCETGITLPVIAGAWHHIRVIRNGNSMTTYLDNAPYTTTLDQNPGSGNGHLNIGVDRTGTSGHVLKGLIDELKIYNVAAAGNNDPASGLIGYWSFDKSGNGKVNIYASPDKASVIAWDNTGKQVRWAQAGGAFYRSIKRN